MTGPLRPFDSSELDGVGDQASAANAMAAARAIEDVTRSEHVSPSTGFEDRVMAAIASAPAPRRAAATGGVAGLFGAIGLAWSDLWGRGRSPAVRAQAMALLVAAAMIAGSIGAIATVGVSNALFPDRSLPSELRPSLPPSIAPLPSVSPTPAATPSPAPSGPASPLPSATPDPTETAEPTETGDSGGSGGSATSRPTTRPTVKPTTKPTTRPTAKPTSTAHPGETEDPSETPEATSGDDGHGGSTPEPTSGGGGSGDG